MSKKKTFLLCYVDGILHLNLLTLLISIDWDDLNHLKITQKIPEQHTRQVRNSELAKNSHIGHSTHSMESFSVKVRNIFHRQNNITCSINCNYRTCFVYKNLNTPHKVDKKADDDTTTTTNTTTSNNNNNNNNNNNFVSSDDTI